MIIKYENMGVKMKRSKNLPLYVQIADDLRTNIRTEKWTEGTKIPTENELCEIYSVSRITIKKAIDELVLESLLKKKVAKGTFVTGNRPTIMPLSTVKSFTQELLEQGKRAKTKHATIRTIEADETIASYLNLNIGDEVVVLERLRGDGESVFAYFESYFPYKKEYSLEDENYYGSFYEYLNGFGITIDEEREYFEAIIPSRRIQEKLKISKNTAVLKRVRFTSNRSKGYYEYTECYYIGDKYRYYSDKSNNNKF